MHNMLYEFKKHDISLVIVKELIDIAGNTFIRLLLQEIKAACWFSFIAAKRQTCLTKNKCAMRFDGLMRITHFMKVHLLWSKYQIRRS